MMRAVPWRSSRARRTSDDGDAQHDETTRGTVAPLTGCATTITAVIDRTCGGGSAVSVVFRVDRAVCRDKAVWSLCAVDVESECLCDFTSLKHPPFRRFLRFAQRLYDAHTAICNQQ